MTGRILRFESGVHRVVDALLPWYVNGTLEADELDYVRRHLGECAQCRQEAEWLRELHAACVAAESMPGVSGTLRNLRRRLEARSTTGDSRPAHAGAGRSGHAWTRWALVASLAVTIAFAASLLRDTDTTPLYRTLGASGGAERASGSVIVVFDPMTTEAELRRILLEAGARVVDGPTQANAYVLDVPARRLDDAIRALRTEHAVVLVERLVRGDGR